MAVSSLLLAAIVPYGPTVESLPTSPIPTAIAVQDEEVVDGKWHGFVEVGGTYTDGNTDVRSARVAAEGVRRWTDDRLTLRAGWNYAKNAGDLTDRNAQATAQWDHFVDEKLYLNAIAGVQTDSLADLDLRYWIGGGVGYQFRDDEKMALKGEAGIVYFNEEFDGGGENDYISARLAYDLDYQVSETTLFEQITEFFPSLEDAEDVYGRVDSKLSFLIQDNWTAFIQHIFNYDNTPADGAERVDNRVVVGIRWTF